MRFYVRFREWVRLSVRGSSVRSRVFWRATGHVLECVGTRRSPNRILETYRSYRERNANRYRLLGVGQFGMDLDALDGRGDDADGWSCKTGDNAFWCENRRVRMQNVLDVAGISVQRQ